MTNILRIRRRKVVVDGASCGTASSTSLPPQRGGVSENRRFSVGRPGGRPLRGSSNTVRGRRYGCGFGRFYRGTARWPFPTFLYERIPRFRRNGGFSLKFVRPYTPSGNRQVSTLSDHTCLTRLSTSTMLDSLAPGTAGRPVGRFLLALRLAESIRHEFSAVNHRWTRPEPSPPASFSTSATVTWL